jgi:hypothetical protein
METGLPFDGKAPTLKCGTITYSFGLQSSARLLVIDRLAFGSFAPEPMRSFG